MAELRRGRSERSQPRDDLSSRSNDRRQKTSKADRRYCHKQNKCKSKRENEQEQAQASKSSNDDDDKK